VAFADRAGPAIASEQANIHSRKKPRNPRVGSLNRITVHALIKRLDLFSSDLIHAF